MQSVVEFEQEKVNMQKHLDERQLNRSRCIAEPLFQKKKKKNIYIYIYTYILKKKKKKRKISFEASPTGRTLSSTGRTYSETGSSKVLPVELNKKWAVAKFYR